MNIDRWRDVVEQVKESFEVIETDRVSDEETGADIESIVFIGPTGKIKLEFVSRPVLLDTKTKYSNRIGSAVEIERVYSDTEKSHSLAAWRWDEAADDWVPFNEAPFINM